jgi:hypothetical protein
MVTHPLFFLRLLQLYAPPDTLSLQTGIEEGRKSRNCLLSPHSFAYAQSKLKKF